MSSALVDRELASQQLFESIEAVVALHEARLGLAGGDVMLVGVTPAEETLRRNLDLTTADLDIVRFLAAYSLSPQLRKLLSADLPDGLTTDGVVAVVFGERPSIEAFEALLPDGNLRRFEVVEGSEAARVHESKQTWALSRRILRLLHGHNALDPALARICRLDEPAGGIRADERTLDEACRAIESGTGFVLLTGIESSGKRSLALQEARAASLDLLTIDCRKIAVDGAAARTQLRAIARECRLLLRVPLLLYVDALEDEKNSRMQLLNEELLPLTATSVIATARRSLDTKLDRPIVEVPVRSLGQAQLAELWHESLGQGTKEDAKLLADAFPMAPGLIHHVGRVARARAAAEPIEPEDVFAGIRAVVGDRLGTYARRLEVTQSWADLVLPADQLEAVVELIHRVRERWRVYNDWGFANKVGKGLGISALFSGPPGTGKTMVCALIAKELSLEIYQVDQAKIVSKWIGETEKNLGALFDAAEATQAVLLFDEADSLFGKRTEVSSSNDRHANLETNYLLQRLESYGGICLLTTNHERNIDPAFLRRLSLHTRFPMPDVGERALLWKAIIPTSAPLATDFDPHELAARYEISGGYIRNAALRAAFDAAAKQRPIDQHLLERAARLELESMGRIVR